MLVALFAGIDAVVLDGTASGSHALTSREPAQSVLRRQAGAAPRTSVVRRHGAGIARAAELVCDDARRPSRRHHLRQGRSRQQPVCGLRRHREDQRSVGGRQGRRLQSGRRGRDFRGNRLAGRPAAHGRRDRHGRLRAHGDRAPRFPRPGAQPAGDRAQAHGGAVRPPAPYLRAGRGRAVPGPAGTAGENPAAIDREGPGFPGAQSSDYPARDRADDRDVAREHQQAVARLGGPQLGSARARRRRGAQTRCARRRRPIPIARYAANQPIGIGPSSLLKNPRHSECIVIQFFYHESAGAGMRGAFVDQGGLFSYIAPEARVPANHPLRKIRELVRHVLGELNRSLGKLYASEGRPSIPPEQLLSALLLQVFYGIRSERQLMEQLDYNLLYRWFVGLSTDDPIWDPTTFTKNRDRLQNGEVFTKFMTKLLNHPQVKPLLSDEHFSVDGTLIEAWASHKSFRPKDGSGDEDGGANFHGQQRKNDTHASTSDPDSRLYRKAAGREAKLCYMGHATMENRHGLAVAGRVTLANGTAERRASEIMLKAKAKAAGHRITVGEDKAYASADHVAKLRALNVTPHVAQNDAITATGKHRRSAVDRRTTRHEGYGMSQSRRAMTECIFGWGKQHGTMRKTKHRGIAAVAADFLLNLIAYNLIRIPKLVAA